jgi:hypothetical protein
MTASLPDALPEIAGLKAGTLIMVAEADYKYGIGPLKLRVERVLNVQRLRDGPWAYIRATEIRWNGTEFPGREVLVRLRWRGDHARTLANQRVGVTAYG